MSRRYPSGYAVTVEPPAWLSQSEAAKALRTNLAVVAALIANGHLEAAEAGPGREVGVTRRSVLDEQAWHRDATFAARLIRRLRDLLRWV